MHWEKSVPKPVQMASQIWKKKMPEVEDAKCNALADELRLLDGYRVPEVSAVLA